MRIAVPTSGGVLCAHFGHCEAFALVDVDESEKTVLKVNMVVPPVHQPGMLPGWLARQGAQVVVAGGMGQRAISLFTSAGIAVHTGAPAEPPEKLALAFLDNSLQLSANTCDRPDQDAGDHRCRH
jgi:predicted Fe-Mo cluster-binding NifX family protein